MKIRNVFKLTAFFLVLCLSFSRCAKEEEGPEEENPTAPASKFTWKTNSGSTETASESYFISAYNNIYANKNGATVVDIVLSDLSKGTYNISPSTGVTLEYFGESNSKQGSSGTVTITENTGALVSGYYSCSFSGGGTISGEFSNVPKK